LVDGTEASLDPATTQSLGAQANLSYVIFDGFGRQYNYKKLKENFKLSELQLRQLIENTIIQVYSKYFEVSRLTESYEIQLDVVEVSLKRYVRAELRKQYGQSNQLELLNAEVDLKNDSASLLTQNQQLKNAKRQLNLLLGQEIEKQFTVELETSFDFLESLENAQELAKDKNVQVEQAAAQQSISELTLKSSRAGTLPKLTFGAGYNYNFTDYGFNPNFQSITSTGPNAGLTLSWNLFDGGKNRTQVKNNQIALKNSILSAEQAELNVQLEVSNAFTQYETAKYVVGTLNRAVETNQVNFARSQELFENGQITSIEFRQAQLNLYNAQLNLNQSTYDAKLSELKLKQLTGALL
jgi:outer membrane protein